MDSYLIRKLPAGIFREFAMVQSLCDQFQAEFLNNYIHQNPNPRDEDLAHDLLRELNRRGFFSLWLPRFLGGRGLNPMSMVVFNEIVGGQSLGVANIVGAHYFGFGLLALSHNYKIMRRLTEEIREGERSGNPCLLSAAVTEPTAGSDREDLRLLRKAKVSCWADKESGGYVVNGKKTFISNAIWARYHIVVTTTQRVAPDKDSLILVVPTTSKGVSVGAPFAKWGQNLCPASEMSFENCFVENKDVALSREDFESEIEYRNYSAIVTDNLLAQSRAGIAAYGAGVCGAVLSKAQTLLSAHPDRDAEWFQGKFSVLTKNLVLSKGIAWKAVVLAQFSGPQQKLLEPTTYRLMSAAPEFVMKFLGRMMLSKQFAQGLRQQVMHHDISQSLGLSSMAKYTASDLAHESCMVAIEIFGADPFQQTLRDLKLLQIYEGTNQLNRLQSSYALLDPGGDSGFKDISTNFAAWKTDLNLQKVQVLRKAFDLCRVHASRRSQGGVNIDQWTEHRQNLGRLQARLENFEFLLQHSVHERDQIRLSVELDEHMVSFVSLCMQLMGGHGYLQKSGMPELFEKALNLRLQTPALEKQCLSFLGEPT